MRIIIFLVIINNSFAQHKIVILDSVSKITVPFAMIQYDGEKGVYSDEKGVFEFINTKSTALTVSSIGYKTKVLSCTTKIDTLYLNPKIEELREITIQKKQKNLKNIKFLKKPNYFGSMILRPEVEILTFLEPNEKILNFDINKVKFSFRKLKYSDNKEKLKNQYSVIRINIYEKLNNSIGDKIFSSKPLKINAFDKDYIQIDLIDEYLTFEKEGFVFGIEYVGNIDNKGEFFKVKKLYLRPSLVKNKSKYFQAKTYLKFPLQNEKGIKLLNDAINENLPKGIKPNFDRNLAISFELSK